MKCISLVIWNPHIYCLLLFCIKLSIATAGYTFHSSLTDSDSPKPSVLNQNFSKIFNHRPSNPSSNAHLRHSTHNQRNHHNHHHRSPYQNNHSSPLTPNSIVQSKAHQPYEHRGRNKPSPQTTTTARALQKSYVRLINQHHRPRLPYPDLNTDWPIIIDRTTIAPNGVNPHARLHKQQHQQRKQQHQPHSKAHPETQFPLSFPIDSAFEYNRPLVTINEASINYEHRKAHQRPISAKNPNRVDWDTVDDYDDNGYDHINIDNSNTNSHADENDDVSKLKIQIITNY